MKIELTNFELNNYEHNERSHGSYLYSETIYSWTGKIKVYDGDNVLILDVDIEDFSSSENGGIGIKIKSDIPKSIDKDELKDIIEEKYNRTKWVNEYRS